MKMLKITLQGKTYEVGVEVVDGAAPAAAPASAYVAPVAAAPAPVAAAPTPAPAPVAAPAPAPVAGGHSVTSPMPGLVMKVCVTVGQQVSAEQEVLVLEAMKMESPVYAPCAGTVASILVKGGDAVSEGQVLIQLS
jgi:biotin carboxyl carrier protein